MSLIKEITSITMLSIKSYATRKGFTIYYIGDFSRPFLDFPTHFWDKYLSGAGR